MAIAEAGALARAKEKEIADIFRPSRALFHLRPYLRAAPGAIYLMALRAGF
jgi:hypothetical protein